MPTTDDTPARDSPVPTKADAYLLLIASPSDRDIYERFRMLARRWRSRVLHEDLVLEGGVPLMPELAGSAAPRAVERVLAANCSIIDRIDLDIGGVLVRFRRSGGHAPYRESFFDEVRLNVHGRVALDARELQQLVQDVRRTFDVAAAAGGDWWNRLSEPQTDERTRGGTH